MEVHTLGAALNAIMIEHDWSQSDLGEKLGRSRAWVSHAEVGCRDTGLARVQDLLGRVGWEVVLRPKPKPEEDDVKRREFNASFVTTAASVAFVPSRKAIPYKDPEYVRGLAARLANSREQIGGQPLIATALRYVRGMQSAISSKDQQLQQAAAELARISSLVFYDANEIDSAEKVGGLALRFARRTDDPRELALIHEHLCMFNARRSPVRAAHYARLGLGVPGLPKEQGAWLNARLATVLARNGKSTRLAESSARSAIETAQGVDGLPVTVMAFVIACSGQTEALLRHHEEADSALEEAVRMFGGKPLLAANWKAVQVRATLIAADPSKAASQMTTLADVMPLVTSTQLDTKVREILALAAPWNRDPEMKHAITRLRSVAVPCPDPTI